MLNNLLVHSCISVFLRVEILKSFTFSDTRSHLQKKLDLVHASDITYKVRIVLLCDALNKK